MAHQTHGVVAPVVPFLFGPPFLTSLMDYDIYREELGIKYPGYGHALWEPSPGGRYTSVEIGDVGFVRQGYFHRLFNILLPEDHPSHQDGVPQHHEPLVLRMTSPTNTSTLQPNNLRSHGVSDRSDEHRLGASGPDEAAQQSFGCYTKQGAILSLPVPAQRKDTTARQAFAKCIIKHIDEWFAFARDCDLGINREDIILVTGCHLTRTWATIAFQGRGEQIAFGVQVSDVSAAWQFTPESAQGVAYNLGPSGQNPPENQCIFIRGFRVTRFSMILPRLRGAAGPSQLPDEDDTNPDTQLKSIPDDTYQDPLRTLLEYIAIAAPDCDMALVHDDDLQYVDNALLGSLRPDTMISFLRRSAPKIWQHSYDTSPTSHGDKGKSKSEAPSQITVAALSKFDMAHEMEPEVGRNMIQEGVTSPSSRRGHRKILVPSNSGSVGAISTGILNAMRKQSLSSQEQRGDDKLEQASDLVSNVLNKVGSVVTNDIEDIEDKINTVREIKVMLNCTSGIRKFFLARQYHKLAKGVYQDAKSISDGL